MSKEHIKYRLIVSSSKCYGDELKVGSIGYAVLHPVLRLLPDHACMP
jgi:hypothetical protein